jgi:hypothetical protein
MQSAIESKLANVLLWLILISTPVSGQETMSVSVDSLLYHSEFNYTQAQIDSLLWQSPEMLLLREHIRHRNIKDSFLSRTSVQLRYDPFNDVDERTAGKLWISLSLPLRLFQDVTRLDHAELALKAMELKLKTRELMKQREELLVELQSDIQHYTTLLVKLHKTEIALSVSQSSRDEVLDAKDHLAELLTSITKKKLEIRLIEDYLKALIGDL